ncbi:MAG: hypothetical protein HKL80_11240 [Acidimicrobiales bacterium]|nr:hypothetical protein [Acidimicrobiales bacterium]
MIGIKVGIVMAILGLILVGAIIVSGVSSIKELIVAGVILVSLVALGTLFAGTQHRSKERFELPKDQTESSSNFDAN